MRDDSDEEAEERKTEQRVPENVRVLGLDESGEAAAGGRPANIQAILRRFQAAMATRANETNAYRQ